MRLPGKDRAMLARSRRSTVNLGIWGHFLFLTPRWKAEDRAISLPQISQEGPKSSSHTRKSDSPQVLNQKPSNRDPQSFT
jgi:hypothetical protein